MRVLCGAHAKQANQWSRTIALGLVRERDGTTPFSHWARAARLYRAWFDSEFAPPSYPSWLRGGQAVCGIDASTDAECDAGLQLCGEIRKTVRSGAFFLSHRSIGAPLSLG